MIVILELRKEVIQLLRKNILLSVLGLTLIGGTFIGVTSVSAQDATDKSQSIIQKLAQRFNLNESDVKAVFVEEHQARQSQMKIAFEQRLTQAVTDGKITEAQKTAILSKFSEVKAAKLNPGQFKNQKPEQRKQTMEQKKSELETWAKENGLTLETLQSLIGHGGKGFGMRLGQR